MSDRALATTQKQTATRITPSISGFLQRKCACGNHTVAGGECEACEDKRGMLQRASLSPRGRGTEGEGAVPPIVHEVLRSPGQPLDSATRAFMEPRFGYDLSQVRVHTDAQAAESARALDAVAYTAGRHHVVFGAGRYAPTIDSGRRLLAHELTHSIQQRLGQNSRLAVVDSPDHEREADAAADDILGQRPIPLLKPLNPRSISRQKRSEAEERGEGELRQLSMLPHLALKKWRTLTQSERDQVQWNMMQRYGPPFTSEFLMYAKGVKKPRPGFGGALKGPQYTPKWLFDRGYRHAYGETWVHPSGEYIFVFKPSGLR